MLLFHMLCDARLRALFARGILLALVAACHETATSPATGSLVVAISGLPASVPAGVIVTGADGYRLVVDSTRTLSSLPSGTYTIAAADVTSGGTRFVATPPSQAVTVDGVTLATASPITYSVSTARVTVNVRGLPGGAPASVTVTGPNGFSRALTATAQIDLLEPGSYIIVASDVEASGTTYRPSSRTQQMQLTPSTVPAISTVTYGSGTGVLDVSVAGLDAGVDADITVTGPGGFTRRVISSTTLGFLEPGVYTTAAAVVGRALTTYRPAAASQTSNVANSSTSPVSVTYAGAPLQLSLTPVATGLSQPVFLTAPSGDARQFIVERVGRIRVVANGVLKSTPFLDITSRVNNAGERGLFSMAFDPAYASNGFFYVYYVDLNGDIAVERFSSTPGSDVAGSGSGFVIVIRHRGREHHGGLVSFGPDGMMYLATGDGGCCGDPNNNAQNLNSLLGKMLRIDVRALPYTIPASNPFVGKGSARAEIWAYGLRSPWRYSFDATSGMLHIADVGEDLREEVDAVSTGAAGLNYGWRLMEGLSCFNPGTNCSAGQSLTLPVYDYPHSEGCSVIGGFVYRGAAIPELSGQYLFTDYCSGWLRSFRSVGGDNTDLRTWAGISTFHPVSFGRDSDGELYIISGTGVLRIVRSDPP